MRVARFGVMALLMGACDGEDVDADGDDPAVDDSTFRFAFLADPHIIGDDYVCCESPGLDTQTIYQSWERLTYARGQINAIDPQPERVFFLGDVMHQAYNHEDLADYTDPAVGASSFHAKRLLDGFDMPYELLWGNHDYEVPEFSREFAHQVFAEIFDHAPYHEVERGGWQWLLLNTQLGPTWDADDPMNPFFGPGQGSFGAEQLAWVEEQLREDKPTFLLFHHPPQSVMHDEDPDGPIADIFQLIEAYNDTIESIYVGHSHTWIKGIQDQFGVPVITMGSVRFDADNFWIFEFDTDAGTWEILDESKAVWLSKYAYTTEYDVTPFLIREDLDPTGDLVEDWSTVDLPGGGPPPDAPLPDDSPI